MKGNRVQLIGYVGTDMANSKVYNGNKRIAIRMATHYKNKNDKGEPKYYTVWHDVIAWDDTAEYAERSFVKGSKIMVDGSISYAVYPDKTGHLRYVTRIIAHSLMNLDR